MRPSSHQALVILRSFPLLHLHSVYLGIENSRTLVKPNKQTAVNYTGLSFATNNAREMMSHKKPDLTI